MTTSQSAIIIREAAKGAELEPSRVHNPRDDNFAGVEARVCSDIADRQRIGIAKYGCTVEASKDDMLQHAYEEALDLAVYLKAEIERRISHENQ